MNPSHPSRPSLSDAQRKRIHDLALGARELLTEEARLLLEGTYGLYADGRLEAVEKLPQVQADPEVRETYERLARFLAEEAQAGLSRREAVERLVKEVAFTHLNRLVAFKMMEARRLIRGTLDRGVESNAFKYYLADPAHAGDLELLQQGQPDVAYRHFLLWQARQVARELKVLFDPDTLASRLFPRPRALNTLVEMLNGPSLDEVWHADETIGWVYQYFNEPELQAAFARVRTGSAKFEAQDIASATQLFTPHWIVRYLVQNTLGRLWVQMHPDTRLLESDLLSYLVPLQGDVPAEPVRPAREITLLDPACGAMHFGLVAFDLFVEMYREELERAGEAGWPQEPSVADESEIAAAIIEHNLFGIDIDLRAVQLAALALYLKAKSLNPRARITQSNLVSADVLPLNGARLGAFLRDARFTRPVYERLIRVVWERLQDATQLGSLLRLERDLDDLVAAERSRAEKAPLFGWQERTEARAEEDFWEYLAEQIIQALDHFAREAAAEGQDVTFFAGEATKGLRLLNLLANRYDVVVTNPPYMNRRKMNRELADLVGDAYPEGKGDLYAAFIQRNLEFAKADGGYVGMLTMHSFMFISSYEKLREYIRGQAAIETVAHAGPALFEVGNPGTLQTTSFVLRREPDLDKRENAPGTYFRLVHAPSGDAKREAFEQALQDGSNTYHVGQRRFDAIPAGPWVYWASEHVRKLFDELPGLGDIAKPIVGLRTSNNSRFLRYWWETGIDRVFFEAHSHDDALKSNKKWFPYMKGGPYRKWYGNQEYIINWKQDGQEVAEAIIHAYPYLGRAWMGGYSDYFKEGITWSDLSTKGFGVRYLPPGFIFDVKGSSGFPETSYIVPLLAVMNSRWTNYVLDLLNPTVSFQKGDISRVPLQLPAPVKREALQQLTVKVIHMARVESMWPETNFEVVVPPLWKLRHMDAMALRAATAEMEIKLNDQIYNLYGISNQDRISIEAELAGETPLDEEGDEPPAVMDDADDEDELEAPISLEELAARWISYAIGIVLGRFRPGEAGALGSAIYRREDFAVGSLPEPDEGEFDQLVGPAERFAYVDEAGSRHVFSLETEQALRALAVPDGIAVLDEGHPRDLATLATRALHLMLGDEAAREVIAEGAGGDASGNLSASLRGFLDRDFFTRWHLKWYRKRPVYWWLQSARRGYGFVIFHEKIDRATLYTLQRDYLDFKQNALTHELNDLRRALEGRTGGARRALERDIMEKEQLLDEVETFAKTMERIVQEGYEPAPDWIDDGVILRLAPLWELVPLWKSEPKKYWQWLQDGKYDWSHIAMRYWPERVREACRGNKSFAIAHGREEWYDG